jgi:8-amino-7-oxononanoate synthase
MLDRMAGNLSALRNANQYRELAIPSGIQLGSNDYLGLSSNAALKDAIARALLSDSHVASTGSRLLSGHHQRWDRLEEEFADFVGVEAALYFASGYAANIGLLASTLRSDDIVFSDAANHSSLIDGIRLSRARKVIFPHLDLNQLEHELRRNECTGQRVIVVESIFSVDGDRAPVEQLLSLCDKFNAFLVVDEAHSTGVEGAQGRGAMVRRHERLLATVHTCGKALASMGAFVAGSRTLREFLINQARTFIFTTALPPYCAAHVSEALKLAAGADIERRHLQQLSRHLRQRLQSAGFDTRRSDSQIIPLVLGSNENAIRFATALIGSGFAVRPIRPPTVPPGTARLRLSLTANLSIAELDAFVDSCVAIREAEAVTR